ncbi:hypothetical protein UFOVP747_7 [uncultured Caudovirales phage]|uniref:Uncharacterized protein n=1 Tax=uncultured Caudovirales phage TaxID=2100421 RepID=A0A6J7X313_9CAUD|nr:hypothetical protein UFOVP675_23 [uncultured Caudovirales phage]CAB5225304.1 hypothetical protein UFOVP747_7 [uncultured Caudovirales phage]
MAYNTFSNTVTIANGASLSSAIAINGSTPVAIIAPAAWTAAHVQIEVSLNGTDFFPLRDQATTLVQVHITAGGANTLPPSLVNGWDFIRLRSVTATTLTDVNQGADRVITIVTQKFST